MLSQLPEQLESERLIIRVAKPGDGAAFNEAIHSSLAELTPWLGWVRPPPTLAESETSCRRAYARFLLNEDLMVLLFLKTDGTLIGGSGLHDADWKARHFEIGYWSRSSHAGLGLMTEAVQTLAQYALDTLGANRVYLSTDARNTRSWKLAERAGFQLEGTLRNERFDFDGALRDTKIYSRVP